jgi:uncharacterized protein (TIGR03086 family)
MTTEWHLLDQAHDALRSAVTGVPAADWGLPTPCANWTVAQVLQHAAGDQLTFAAFLTGGEAPAENPFAPTGDLAAEPAAIAWGAIEADAAEVSVPVPPNTMTAELGVGACALDAAVHAWDIAVATGQSSPLDEELSRTLLQMAEQIVEPLRPYGAYAAVIAPEPGDDAEATLLRYLGRRPEWTPQDR